MHCRRNRAKNLDMIRDGATNFDMLLKGVGLHNLMSKKGYDIII